MQVLMPACWIGPYTGTNVPAKRVLPRPSAPDIASQTFGCRRTAGRSCLLTMRLRYIRHDKTISECSNGALDLKLGGSILGNALVFLLPSRPTPSDSS